MDGSRRGVCPRGSPLACFAFCLACGSCLSAVAVVTGGIVVCSSTWSPAVFRPMSSSATVRARLDVGVACVACAISFLVLVFAFALPLAFLETVDLHPVIVCARSISS